MVIWSGVVTTKQASVQKSNSDTTKVEEIMIPVDELIVMRPDALANEALKRKVKENKSRIFVYEDSDRIAAGLKVEGQERQTFGLISKTDILNVARERKDFEKEVEKLDSTKMDYPP